jgi:hypothetical protein
MWNALKVEFLDLIFLLVSTLIHLPMGYSIFSSVSCTAVIEQTFSLSSFKMTYTSGLI